MVVVDNISFAEVIKLFEAFSTAVMEWSAILGLCVIVGSVIYTAYRVVTR